MKLQRFATVILFVAAVPSFCQTETQAPIATPDDSAQNEMSAQTDESSWRLERTSPVSNVESNEMKVPPPLRTVELPMEFASRKPTWSKPWSNYVSGGLRFMNSFNDNIGLGFSARRISDNSYSVMPTLSWGQSSSRILWNLAYTPEFTVYHHHSELNYFPQKLSLDSQFRLSPHMTLSVLDRFEETADPFSQLTPDLSTSTGLSQPPVTIISPVTDRITNLGSAQLTYQFGLNSMIGARGLFNDLHYLNPSQVPGFANSHANVAEGFYSHRISVRQYLGAKYAYQYLLATPHNALTETHGIEVFYTIYLQPTTWLSFYAGPQYSDSGGGGLPATKTWSPSYGGSFDWKGQHVSLAVSGGRSIGSGWGLQGAVRTEYASALVSRQLTKSWNAGVRAFYWNNALLTPQLSSINEGHSIEGTVSLGRRIKESLNLELWYTRLHQSYQNLSTLSASPNINRVGVSLRYEFTKPIGR